MINRRQS